MPRFRRQTTCSTQPPTPHHRRQRNLSFSPRDTSATPQSARGIETQTSFMVDEPISHELNEDYNALRGSVYSSYLRQQLRDVRSSSMDDGAMDNSPRPFNYFAGNRRNPLMSRAVSIDEPRYDNVEDTSWNSTIYPRPSEKPPLQSIQSCAVEEESDRASESGVCESSKIQSPDLIVSPPEPDIQASVHFTPIRRYKPRRQTTINFDAAENESEPEIPYHRHSPPEHTSSPATASPSICRGGCAQKTSRSTRMSKIKSLKRSRTIEVRIHDDREDNRERIESSAQEPVPSNSIPNTSVQGLKDSREHLTHLLNKNDRSQLRRCLTQKKPSRDAETQAANPSIILDRSHITDLGMDGVRPIFDLTEVNPLAGKYSEVTSNQTSGIENPLQMNAAAMADGYLEESFDPSKQSTSSYLKEQFFAFFQPSDNKLAMKLFGSKSALNKEKRRQQQQGKWIIHPCSSFRFYWDLLMLTLLIANLIILPVAISFFYDDLRAHWIVFNSVSDAVFIADIAVKFRTGIITNDYADEIILNPREIARQYVRSWFLLDLISSIPMDYIFWVLNKHENYNQILTAGRTLRILRLAKLLSMLRLLRLTRLVRYVSQWEEFLNIASKFMGIFNLVLLMLLLGHWNACLQFLIPLLMDYPENSWVQRCKLKDADWFEQYTWALFKAMSHMLSIGYGRFPPTSISEAWITIVSMMTGATCYALFVGHAAALIQSFDTSKRLYREKFKQVEEYMAYRKLPRALRQRIAEYYEHRYQGNMFDEAQILTELSECLREQIINYNCRELVAAVPFFTYADQDFVSEMVTNLKFEVFQPGDVIIKEGTIGTKMYFIQEGIVDIITKDGEIATTLSDGSYFGEICLLTNAKRVASVRAEVYSNLYSLDRECFLAVLDNYPLMRRTMESVAAERLSKIGQNPAIVSTRADLKADLSLVKEIVSSVAASDDETDSGSDNDDEERGGKEERSIGPLRRVLNRAKRSKKSSTNPSDEEVIEAIQKHDANATKYLTVPKPERFHHRIISITSGVSKLFKRGGMFGEHTDVESEAYLSWDRARQQRYTQGRASMQPLSPCTPPAQSSEARCSLIDMDRHRSSTSDHFITSLDGDDRGSLALACPVFANPQITPVPLSNPSTPPPQS